MELIKKNPKNASAVIIFNKNKVLLQQRDKKKNIFYPGFWGLFGGAKEHNENYKTTALREIREELTFDFKKNLLNYFFKMQIEFPFKNKIINVNRYFFIYEIKNINFFYENLKLNEGKNLKFFNLRKYIDIQITPYDKLAIDMFYDLKI